MSTDSQLHPGLGLFYRSALSQTPLWIQEIDTDPLRDVATSPAENPEFQSTAECIAGRPQSCALVGPVFDVQASEFQVGQCSGM